MILKQGNIILLKNTGKLAWRDTTDEENLTRSFRNVRPDLADLFTIGVFQYVGSGFEVKSTDIES